MPFWKQNGKISFLYVPADQRVGRLQGINGRSSVPLHLLDAKGLETQLRGPCPLLSSASVHSILFDIAVGFGQWIW